jgi:hypothetical protein
VLLMTGLMIAASITAGLSMFMTPLIMTMCSAYQKPDLLHQASRHA